MAKMFATPPPRTKEPGLLGLSKAQGHQPLELAALEEERAHATAPEGDLARAVLAQSQALTALVGQIAQSSEDPMMDLGATASSASTRGGPRSGGASSRTCLSLWELLHVGAEGTGSTGSAEDLLRRGVSGTMYMERFGGFGRHRDLGLILFQVMTVMDFMQAENHGAAKDALALLAVCIDQAVMDGGRFDLASLLTLQEDPLISIYINRQQSSLSRARAFSPLADQRWVTVALAFVKELGVILSKRLELTGAVPGSSKAQPSEAAAKSKLMPKKKGKGGGKAASSGHWPSSSGRGGGVADALPAKNQSMPAVSSPEGRAKPSARHYEFHHLGHLLATVDFAVEV